MEDEESWLYGDAETSQTGETPKELEEIDNSQNPAENLIAGEDSSTPFEIQEVEDEEEEAGNEAQNEENADEHVEEGGDDGSDDDDDSDDDGFKITIDKDKIEEAKTSYQTFGLSKPVIRPAMAEKKGKFSVEEFDQIGMINGQVAIDMDLESIEDKPWRQPGSDLSDYFNYGFTEDTWNAYCQRQRRMRTGESGVGMPNTNNSGSGVAVLNITSKIISSNTFSGGQIPTLGVASSNGTSSNRIVSNLAAAIHQPPPAIPVVESPAPIAVMTSDKRNYSTKKVIDTIDFSMPPPGLMPPGPPPTFDGPPPVFDGPPPVFDGPPPILVPPGMLPPSIGEFVGDDPFGYNYGGYEPTQESQWSLPPPAESFHPPPGDVPPGDPSYEDRGDRDAWGRGRTSRDKSPTPRSYDRRPAPAEYAERDGSSRRRRRSRSRSRERVERFDRYRDRDRDRDREKRDRERRRPSRSRSPRSPSGSDRHKHKKSKKDKREDRRDKVEIKKEKEDD